MVVSDETAPAPLADADQLATLTGLAADDSKLVDALDRATGRFIDAIGYDPRLTTGDVITLNGDGGQTLILPAFPVGNVVVEVDGVTVTDVQVDAAAGILRRPTGWPDRLGCVQVTCDHGLATIPTGISDAILEAAQITLTTNPAVQSRTLGVSSVEFGASATVGVTQRWVDAVARYRR